MKAVEKTRRDRAPREPRGRHVRYYNLLMFATPFSGIAYCRCVAEFVAGRDGKAFTSGAQRPTLWIASTGVGDGSCYVYASDAALDAARAAGLEAPVVGYAVDSELPYGRCLFLGDVGVGPASDRKGHSAALLALCLEAKERRRARLADVARPASGEIADRAEVL